MGGEEARNQQRRREIKIMKMSYKLAALLNGGVRGGDGGMKQLTRIKAEMAEPMYVKYRNEPFRRQRVAHNYAPARHPLQLNECRAISRQKKINYIISSGAYCGCVEWRIDISEKHHQAPGSQ